MKKKIVCYYPFLGTELNDSMFKNTASWEYYLKCLLEKDDIEIHTYDKVDLDNVDYVLFFDNIFYQNLDIMWKLYNKKLLEKSVYINYEPVTGHAKNHDAKGMENLANIFSKIITFDDDIVDNKKFIKGNIANFYSKEKEYKHDFKDRRLITMISNNTTKDSVIKLLNYYNYTKYFNRSNIKEDEHSIYLERVKVANYFLKKHKDDFDLYGGLWSKKYNKIHKGYVEREEKLDILSKYKFAFSYDSYTNQNGYISEKIFDCFKAKTVPIYLGADNVTDYIPKECFIDKRDFKTYDELYNYLVSMDEKTYEHYIKNIEKFLNSSKYKEYFSSEQSAKRIKTALMTSNKINYLKAYNSLMYFENRRRKVHKKKIMYYTLRHIYHKEHKIEVNFKVRRGSNIRIESNGLVEPKDIRLDYTDSFSVKFDYSVKDFFIKVYNINADEYFNFISMNEENDREFGLLPKTSKTLIYYNYSEAKGIKKLLYVLLHNKRTLLKRIKRQL